VPTIALINSISRLQTITKMQKIRPGANAKIASYNASVVKNTTQQIAWRVFFK
jgi:hypothetical protein